ncbi:MAG: aminotransferase class V-fold PLP-dependent enzyme [Acidobacteriales bacterium]|nr:aminotransferase class V-fold PLP-dependent enzyme [Terriglobales bacterium]
MIDVSSNGALSYLGWLKHKESARSLLAGMMNVRSEQVAFTRNTSDGIATIANGLPWREGDNIVTFANEFPANWYAWKRIRDEYGIEIRLCPEREGRIDLDEFCSMIDHNTRVVAISAVQYASGFKADLERIGRNARAVDALFVVDVIQGLGAAGYDLPAQLVDAASGASHKWLCAPEGCGFVYLSDRARERVKPTLVGWISVDTPWDFIDREQDWRSTALAWESGTGCSSLFYGLEQSLKLLTDTGLANIEQHTLGLSDQLCDGLGGKNYDIISSRAPHERSAIVCIKHRNGHPANEIAASLEKQKIIVSPRGDRLRIAPHFYNNSGDIDRLIEALP